MTETPIAKSPSGTINIFNARAPQSINGMQGNAMVCSAQCHLPIIANESQRKAIGTVARQITGMQKQKAQYKKIRSICLSQ